MKPRGKSQKGSQVQGYIDRLVHPPSLFNPLKRSASLKNNSDEDVSPLLGPSSIPRPSPMKPRSKSDDKASSIYTSSKNYNEAFSSENSAVIMRMSDLDQTPLIKIPERGVTFRESIIKRNEHNRRDNIPSQCKTPSILKQSRAIRQKTIQRMQSINNNSHISSSPSKLNEDRESRASRTNEVVKRRFSTILERFQTKYQHKIKTGGRIRNDEKYKDELFPPILSSIYRGGVVKNRQLNHDSLQWIRIPDLFKDKKLFVWHNRRSNIQIYCNQWKDCNNFIGDSFTAIKDSRFLMNKIFQNNEVNQFGVYLVKIFQENVWKYVIVDDFIPTIKDENGSRVPLFINICEVSKRQQPLQIWPFLLEKAYANYYANYESLHCGNTLDFLEEITGSPSEQFKYSSTVKKMQSISNRLGTYLQRDNMIYLGYIEQMHVFVPIYKNYKGRLVAKRSFQNQSEQVSINIDNIFDYFDNVYVIGPQKWEYSAVSTVGLNIKRSSNQIPRFDISLRVLKVEKDGHVSISIRQKERRFYQSSSLNYKYFWNRVLILQKQFDGDCRWITGKYSPDKTINFTDFFEAGQYYIVLMPEWKLSHCYEQSVLALATVPVTLTRKEYDDKQHLVEKGCADLAQRRGKLQQISMYACSYCVVDEEVGLMIENINNERFNGDIRINRSIGSIRSLATVVPFNFEFYHNKGSKLPFKTNISIFIPNDKSFTVVLMTHGGIDKTLLKRFDFAK